MRLARGRAVVFFDGDFDIECVSDQVRTALGGKIWVVDDMLAMQSSPRRQFEREGINPPRDFNRRRRLGVNHAAGSSSVMTELAELGAGRPSARCAGARRAPHTLASRRASAAGSAAACRSRAPQIYGLEGHGHALGTGPAARLRSCTTRNESRDSHGPVLVHLGGSIHDVNSRPFCLRSAQPQRTRQAVGYFPVSGMRPLPRQAEPEA